MRIDVWSDVVCPWCYIGKRRLEAALAQLPQRDRIEVVYHAFELDPRSPKTSDLTLDQMLMRKYGMGPDRVRQMQAQVTQIAGQAGLPFALDQAKPENTFDAHRLVQLAATQGKQLAMVERLFAAYFTEGKRLGSHDVLAALADEVGVTGARETLADPQKYAAEARADEQQAQRIGIRGVPFYVFDEKYAVSGAQPVEVMLGAIRKAWDERPPEVADGAACEDLACDVGAKSSGGGS